MSSHQEEGIFDSFTRQYALSKTLRFELKPVGETVDNMRTYLEYDKDLQTFLKDQRIEDAYQTLKPCIDILHEEFISHSLNSFYTREARFREYVDLKLELLAEEGKTKKFQKNKESDSEDDRINKIGTRLDNLGVVLRQSIGEAFDESGEKWKKKYSQYKWKKGSATAKGVDVLFCEDILTLIGDIYKEKSVQSAVGELKGYLGGFNQNRKNYYETKKESSAAIATRIVHENLPRFTDNVFIFETHKEQYLGIYDFLKNLERTLVSKDGTDVNQISEAIFSHSHFHACLSQNQIEKYNKEIGNANFLINLYNQAKTTQEQKSKKISLFKSLRKQIGCGKADSVFFVLTHEKKLDADCAQKENRDKKFFSVEETLNLAKIAGEKYFIGDGSGKFDTVPQFVKYVIQQDDYSGFYLSKSALNTISGKYFENWHDLKDRLKEAQVFKKGGKAVLKRF